MKLVTFLPKKIIQPKIQIWENRFLGQHFPDFETQIGQQHFFIIWQDAQYLHQLFFTNISPNGPTGNKSVFGSKIKNENLIKKKTLSVNSQIANTFLKNF